MGGKCAVITGSSGQDGRYLIEFLLSKGYEVHAQSRGLSPEWNKNSRLHWHTGSLADDDFLERLIIESEPDEFYNLAAVTRPALSWIKPNETTVINAVVPQKICNVLARHRPYCRLFQASTSDIFGGTSYIQNESTPLDPLSPYAASKCYADQIVRAYRRRHGLHFSTGVLFNHESPYRPIDFVSQKIAYAAAFIGLGISIDPLSDERGNPIVSCGQVKLGNLSARRDFGYAGDYVEAMVAIANHSEPDDYVIGTGESHSIAELCEVAFRLVGKDWTKHVSTDVALMRKDDANTFADTSKIKQKLGWYPKTSFSEMITLMVQDQIKTLEASPRR